MKNRIALFISLFLVVHAGYSQSPQLTIEGTGGRYYLLHTVVAKENWYSIGRLFNLSPREIASFNNLNMDSKPLEVNQQLNIPLTRGNFDQKPRKLAGESLIPIYHVVKENEWMFRISSMYNDVPVASLEKWNNIKKEEIKQGIPLIVGFLKVRTELSPLAQGIASNPVTGNPTADLPDKSVKTAEPATVRPADKAVVASRSPEPPAAIPVNNTSEKINAYAASHSNGGFFNIDYTGTGKSANGLAGTFKSTSGWSDGKYYALMNGVAVGTIIRVTGSNGKTIYAKVLGQLPEMKESSGLLIRVSNAASAELGLGEGKFPVEVRY